MKGKVAIVTGAFRGIGRSIALELAANGADIVINDYLMDKDSLELVKNIELMGVRSKIYIADVSCKDKVFRMISDIKKDFGHIDILINNAGISPKHCGVKSPVYEMDPEEWDSVIKVNLGGAFYCTRYVAPLMIDEGWGRIVNISSMAGRIYSPVAGAHYCASKAGILGFTRVCAGELAPFNVIVNAVAPGRIQSNMMEMAGEDKNLEILKSIPIGQFGQPEDVAKIVRYLASDENKYIVGATIDINGGRVMI